MLFTMFCEDGKGSPVSMRRVGAFLCLVMSVVYSWVALPFSGSGWWVFIPTVAYLVGMMLLLFFTTWGDVAQVANAWKGKVDGP